MINDLESQRQLAIQLLGPVVVRCGECILPKVRSKKGIWLLALLALRANKPVSRDWLAATLWPDSDTPRETLRRTLTDLRQALGECGQALDAETRFITLRIPEQNVDVHEFDLLARSSDLESLERAIVLYKGPLLQDCQEVWSDCDRAQRAEAYVQALQSAARMVCESRADLNNAIEYLRSAIEVDPFRESLYRGLMQALAAKGDRAAAVQAYRSLRVRLHDETRTEPSPETLALYRSLQLPAHVRQSGQSAIAPILPNLSADTSATNLPRPLTELVGRQPELAQIADGLAKSRLVTIAGMGGLGKTRLAIEAGLQLLERHSNGVWFVDLATVTDGAGVARALAAVISLREESDKPLESSLCDTLREHNTLIVMDNCEHVLDAAARLVRALVMDCPHLHVLATSRQSLGLTGEVVLRLEPLQVPNSLISPPTPPVRREEQWPAISLFAERAAAVQPGFALTPQNYSAVTTICRRLDGIPLALELAAVRVRSLSVEQIAARLDDRFRLLISGDRAAQPRQQTLRGLVDWSYDLLEPRARLLFARLSIFAGGCTLEAAENICADSDTGVCSPGTTAEDRPRIDVADVIDLLTDLVEKSLVQVEAGAIGDNRYLMLETLRQYADEKLQSSGELAQLRQKHLHWYLRCAEAAEAEMRGPNQNVRLREVLADNDNFRQALVEAGPGLERMRLAAALFWHWYIHGFYAEGRLWIDRALKECPAAPTALLCKTMKAAGDLCWALGDLDAARDIHLRNLEIQREAQDRKGIALSYNSLGLVAYHRGECAEAIANYRTGLEIMRDIGETIMTGVMLMNLSLPIKDQGDYVEAEALLAEADGLHRSTGNIQGLGAVLQSRCLIAKRLGDYVSARKYIEEAMEVDRRQENPQGEAVMLHTLGEIALFQKEIELAERSFHAALERFSRVGSKRAIAASLYCMALVFCERKDFDQARTYHLESLRIEADLKNRPGIISSLRGLAALDGVSGKPERATTLLGAAATHSLQSGTPIPPNLQADHDLLLESLRSTLGDARFTAGWTVGGSMTLDQAIAMAQLQ